MPLSNPSETSADDDPASFASSLESCRTYLRFVAFRVRGGEGDAGAEGASDLVQQTMLVALKKFREGKAPGPDPRGQRAWLRQILINLLREQHRKARREPERLDGSVADSGTSPSGVLVRSEQAEAVNRALDHLGPEDREIVTWRCMDGLSYQEIGRRRGYSDTYARKVVHQLLGRVRSRLAE